MAQIKGQVSELLSAYLDGELDERDARRAKELLQKDAGAKRLYEEMRRNRDLLGSLPRHEAPPSIHADVQAFVERAALLDDLHSTSDARTLRVFLKLVPLAMAASLTFVIIGGWWYYQRDLRVLKQAADSVASSETARDLTASAPAAFRAADPRPLEARLVAGAAIAELQSHPFANESVRLDVIAENESQKREITRRIESQLAAANLTNLNAAPPSGRVAGGEGDRGFYLRGQVGRNYAPASEEQILVRATLSQAATIVDQLPSVRGKEPQVQLQAGALNVEGKERARQMLEVVAGRSAGGVPESSKVIVAERSSESSSRARMLEKPAVRASDATAEEKVLEDILTNFGIKTEAFRKEADRVAAAPEEPGKLVDRRQDALVSKETDADKASASEATADSAAQPPATVALNGAKPDDARAQPAPEEAEEGYVTFVIQIKSKASANPPSDTPAPTPPNRPGDRHRS